MLNVSEAVKQAYINGNAKAEIFLTVTTTGGTVYEYTPRNILSGSVSIVESLCTSDNFDLSRVEKNQLTFTLFNITENISDLQGASVVAKQRVYTDASDDTVYTDIPLGVYTVDTAELDGVYLYKCTCFDSTMLAFDAVIDDFWNNDANLTFPVTIRNLAVKLFTYLNVNYNIPSSFTNSTFQIQKRTAYFEQIKASELLGYMQEVVGGYFKADRNGVIHLKTAIPLASGLYPHVGLYPRTGLYPRKSNRGFGEIGSAGVGDFNYPQIVGDLNIADYIAQSVTKVQIRATDNDIGIIVGTGTNTYVVQGNPLLYNLTDATGRPIATNILNAVKDVYYRPFSGKFMALPFIEVGDIAKVTTLNGRTFDSPIFQRTLSGAHLAFDNYTSPGFEYREQVRDTNRLLMTLNNTQHEFRNEVDTLQSTIREVSTNVGDLDTRVTKNETDITQTSKEINLSARRSGTFNLLTNSDFSDQNNRTRGWNTSNMSSITSTLDDKFVGGSEDYNKIDNRACLRFTVAANKTALLYQTLTYDGAINDSPQTQISIRLVSSGTVTAFFRMRTYDSTGTIDHTSDSPHQTVNGRGNTTTCLRYWWNLYAGSTTKNKWDICFCVVNSQSSSVSVEINHFLATLDSTAELPPYSWTDYASKDLISQINIAPSGIKIAADKLAVDASSLDLTFGSDASHVEIKSTLANDGILFDGSGKTEFNTKGEFRVKNLDSSGTEANRILATNSSSESSAEIYNYWNGVKANYLDLTGKSSENAAMFMNRRIGADISANYVKLDALSSEHTLSVMNTKLTGTSSVAANGIVLKAISDDNTLSIENACVTNTSGALLGNRLKFESLNESSVVTNTALLRNYRGAGYYANDIELKSTGSSNTTVITNKYYNGANTANEITLSSTSAYNLTGIFNNNSSGTAMNFVTMLHQPGSNWNRLLFQNNTVGGATSNWIQCSAAGVKSDFQFYNYHNNGNLANAFEMTTDNNSADLSIKNMNSSGVLQSGIYLNHDGTMQIKTFVNGTQKCMIQASTYGNLDLVTEAALHINAGQVTVQDGNTYKVTGGSGGNPTSTDNVTVKNWNGTQNAVLHFKHGLYLGYTLQNA